MPHDRKCKLFANCFRYISSENFKQSFPPASNSIKYYLDLNWWLDEKVPISASPGGLGDSDDHFTQFSDHL